MSLSKDMLKIKIKSSSLSQREIAEKLGVGEITVSNWVTGKTLPHKSHEKKLCNLLHIDSDIPEEWNVFREFLIKEGISMDDIIKLRKGGKNGR